MNFLGFPFLVQEEILRNFSNTEKVILAFCSKKSAQVIRKLRLNPKRVQYIINGNVSDENLDKAGVTIRMVYAFSWIPEHRRMQLQIGGNTIRYVHSHTHSTAPSPCSEQKSRKYIEDCLISRIQDHINFIFPRSTNRQFITDSSDIPIPEKLKNLHEISLGFIKYSAEELETSLRQHPDLRGLRFGFSDDTFRIKGDSPLLSIGKLNIFKSNPKTTETLLGNFNGRFLRVDSTNGSLKMFMDFVKKWISGEGYENVKAVEVLAEYTSLFEWNLELIGDNIEAMVNEVWREWDPKRRPSHFEVKERMLCFNRNQGVDNMKSVFLNEPIDCSLFYDIQRNDGKKLASFFISQIEFKFLVWEDHEWNRV